MQQTYHFNRNICTSVHLCSSPSSQLSGSSTVCKIMQIKVKSCSLGSHQTSERGKCVISKTLTVVTGEKKTDV